MRNISVLQVQYPCSSPLRDLTHTSAEPTLVGSNVKKSCLPVSFAGP